MSISSASGTIVNNTYSYDAVNNIIKIKNDQIEHSYDYDNLYRLISAIGNYAPSEDKSAVYSLQMQYDNMHRITRKQQTVSQNGIQFNGSIYAGYDLTYNYNTKNKFHLSNIVDINYRSETEHNDNNRNNSHIYSYDGNGNLTYVSTGRIMKDGHLEENISEKKLKWSEENWLLGLCENGYVSTYLYDANGERTVKLSGNNESAFVNTVFSGGKTDTYKYSLYPNSLVACFNGQRYTNHVYIGAERIASEVRSFTDDTDPRGNTSIAFNTIGDIPSINYNSKLLLSENRIDSIYTAFELSYNGSSNDTYEYSPDVEGSIYALSATSTTSTVDPMYFYHTDHLGSTSYITDTDGEVSQHVEYVPFGEVFIEELSSSAKLNTPFLFNGKELDEETGLYYYGARYYDPRTSLWLSTDPMELKYPNVSTYAYCANNPVKFIDLDGNEWTDNQNKTIENTANIKVFIFYVNDFKKQALIQYDEAIKQYGSNSVAMSNTGTTSGFANDWVNMEGNDIQKILIMTHGKNQSIRVDNNDGNGVHQFTSTGNGKTNLTGTDAYDVSNLGTPKGKITNATLYMYSCHSADKQAEAHGSGDHRQGALSGTMLPIAHRFAQKFDFSKVVGTQGAVNYNSFFTNGTPPSSPNYMKPYPEDGKWINIVKRK